LPEQQRVKAEPNFGRTPEGTIEVSIVMPCLNEADTLGICVQKAQNALREHRINGEIIVADNGSTDASRVIAEKMGAQVIAVQAKGYGTR